MKLSTWQKDILEHGELYRVGGVVRDALFGIRHLQQDEDYLVRGISPHDLEDILNRHGRATLVGKSFGVYKFKAKGEAFDHDVAFPRKEVSTGPGHRDFDVESDHDLPIEDDLGRRDFTINAVGQSVRDGGYVDPFNGRKDIESRTLRMIFPRAFEEDPLRILRGIRFKARFDLTIEADTADAMKAAVPLLDTLSLERVQEEFNKLLVQCEEPSEGINRLQQLGAIAVLLPELERAVGIDQNVHHPDDVYWHSLKSVDKAPQTNLLVRWAALMHDLGKVDAKQTVSDDDGSEKVVFYGHEDISADMTHAVLTRLRFSNDFIKRCRHLVQQHMIRYDSEWNRSTVRRFIRRIGEEHLDDMFALKEADVMSRDRADKLVENNELRERVRQELDEEHALKIADMAIDGRDVMKHLGLEPGERVGEILHELFDKVIEDPSLNDRDTLLGILMKDFK
jgi:poly(A) polymerase/tRNA nucleotidyltransferase (CCA-adding enzyme)